MFKYSSVNIPAGVIVTFKNHPSRAPVVWLVQGNATIAGTVNLDGKSYVSYDPLVRNMAEPGPGGFRGGAAKITLQLNGGPGLGPGGARNTGPVGGSYESFAVYATEGLYGNVGVVPLVGGSGGGGAQATYPSATKSGGSGGGAFLLAVGDMLTLSGAISANGGNGYYSSPNYVGSGSGGGLRLIADRLFGAGSLAATFGVSGGGYAGGRGRIRIEVNQSDWTLSSSPAYTFDLPGTDPQIWLPADKPRVKIVSLGGATIPADPRAGVTFDGIDAYLATSAGTKTLVIQAENVPLTWHVRARVAPINGASATWVNADLQWGGSEAMSAWQADLTLSQYYTAIQVRASLN